jgi:uncharacterized protein YndB with AHSA1/START domain
MPVTDVQKDFDAFTMTMTAELDAPVERVWQLWADPRQLERWWGPPSHPATFTEYDFTPGGRAAYYMTAPDGARPRGWWRIKEVDPMSRLLIEDGFGEEGEQNDEMPGPGHMIITFEESGGRTTMAIESHHASREELEQMIEMGAEQGMVEALGQVDAILAE